MRTKNIVKYIIHIKYTVSLTVSSIDVFLSFRFLRTFIVVEYNAFQPHEYEKKKCPFNKSITSSGFQNIRIVRINKLH